MVDDTDLGFLSDAEGPDPRPNPSLRSREEYLRELRQTWHEWLPQVPVPFEWRTDPDAADPAEATDPPGALTPTPDSSSSNPGSGSEEGSRIADDTRTQDRVHGAVRPSVAAARVIETHYRSRPPPPPQPATGHSIGAGYLLLTLRELTGLSQRKLAKRIGSSQSAMTRIETGNQPPTLRTLVRAAEAASFHVVLGLAEARIDDANPAVLELDDLALVGLLVVDPQDGLPNFRVIREPPPWAGPHA